MSLTAEQRSFLEIHGYTVDCESPLELSLQRGTGLATGEVAEHLLLLLEAEHRQDVKDVEKDNA